MWIVSELDLGIFEDSSPLTPECLCRGGGIRKISITYFLHSVEALYAEQLKQILQGKEVVTIRIDKLSYQLE